MHVIATAGHVDHGKSALVRALTGMEPDRWVEEQRRGLTIDLGFAWTTLASGDVVAFVDVPGHERFVTNMLAGVGPVPAVMLVVAADEGWMPQTDEHVRALDAFGVQHGLLVVTKTDRANPLPVIEDVTKRLADTSLRGLDAVTVSATKDVGVDDVRDALARLVRRLPAPDTTADVRLWIDRCFTVRGAGTVVTGTLAGGSIRVGDLLSQDGTDSSVVVRGLQSRGQDLDHVRATARVAVNLRGIERTQFTRGAALVTPGRWQAVAEVDLLVDDLQVDGTVPRDVVAHIGSAAVSGRARRLGEQAIRIRLDRALPLRPGDRLLLREPSNRRIVGATVADLNPPALRRRGDAARVAAALRAGQPWRPPADPVIDAPAHVEQVDLASIGFLLDRLATDPFAAPDRDELKGLDRAALSHASQQGLILGVGGGIYVSADAPAVALARLATLAQPFTVSAAAGALGASRRVVVPLLEHLDATRRTRRLADGTRFLVAAAG